MDTKENLEKARESYLRMVKRYNEDIDCMEKTEKDLDGNKVSKDDINVSKEMRQMRLKKINEITANIQKYYGNGENEA